MSCAVAVVVVVVAFVVIFVLATNHAPLQARRSHLVMVAGQTTDRHRTIALFDVDGTLTVPRKVRVA